MKRQIRLVAVVLAVLTVLGGGVACTNGTPSTPNPDLGLIPEEGRAVGFEMNSIDAAEDTTWELSPIPPLGIALSLPEEWEIQGEGFNYLVAPPNDDTYIQIGLYQGFSTFLASELQDQLTETLQEQDLPTEDWLIRDTSIGLKNIVFVSGESVAACHYAYVLTGAQIVVLRFAPGFCTEEGRLNETAFRIIRTMQTGAPTQ